MVNFAVFLSFFFSTIVLSTQIYVPGINNNQKPAYTTGIKTTNWTPQIQQNYSRVQSNQETIPVYNGHTYGSRPQQWIQKSEKQIHMVKKPPSVNIAVYQDCPEGSTGQFVYALSCNQFLNCWKGRGYVQNCAAGTLFNPRTLECDFSQKVHCISGPSENYQLPKAKIKQAECPEGFSGLIPHYEACSKFIQCNDGYEYVMDCPPGTLFDFTRNVCQHADKAVCFGNKHEKGQVNSVRYSSNKIECPPNAAGIVEHPTDCSKFLQCSNGQTFIQDCGPGTLFNPKLSVCDHPYNVHCTKSGSKNQNENQQGHNVDGYYNSNKNNQNQYSTKPTNVYHTTYENNYNQGQQNGFHQDQKTTDASQNWQYGQSNNEFGSNPSPTENINYSANRNSVGQQEFTGIQIESNGNSQSEHNHQKFPTYETSSAYSVLPFRKPYEPFYGSRTPDDEDINHLSTHNTITIPIEKTWPPPFPSTDVNADYVFEYEDGVEFGLEPENSKKTNKCEKSDFFCSPSQCISRTQVCDGFYNCPNNVDEHQCIEYLSNFNPDSNHKLAILEKERWNNVTVSTCAYLCLEAKKFQCKSFNYRKIDRSCFLLNSNNALTGALISYTAVDYYERTSEIIDCSNLYVCPNKKCINTLQICDGHDDCGDRTDEKGCKSAQVGYSIRLTGGSQKHEGRLEVTAFNRTGYICDDLFSLSDANVACKELGFPLGALQVKGNSFYPPEKNRNSPTFYMMDDLKCSGNEIRLIDCDFSGWGVHNCRNEEVVGVVCKTPQEKCRGDYWQCATGQECLPLAFVCDGLLDCADGSDESPHHCDAPTAIRLVNGTNLNEGRIEIRHHGTWGTICDDDFNEDAAKVICNSLGFHGSSHVRKDGFFGPGKGPIWLDQVYCFGNESSVEQCIHWDWGEHNCEHGEDVGVVCSNNIEINPKEKHSSAIRQIEDIYPRKCGLRKDNIFGRDDGVHFRVVKGSIAQRGDYPWQAAVRVKGKDKAAHWCGAVIIAQKFVLTAAHCLIGYAKGAYVIVAGDYNIDLEEGTEQQAYIEDFYIHPDFRKGHKMNNDIALVKLKGHGFRFTDDIQPICLPDDGVQYQGGLNCTISGFGSIESGKSGFSHDLRAGWVPTQSKEICSMPHVYGDVLTEGMVCAGTLEEGVDSCDGDSGGPLACLHNGFFTLFGITSWGQHCGYANKPGVYVNVIHYKRWIDENLLKYASV